MIIFTILLVILTIFTTEIISATEGSNNFDQIPEEVLRLISEFTDNPFIFKSLTTATNKAIPSAQTQIANKFSSEILKSLPSTSELWHLFRFRAELTDLLKDSARFLPQSWPTIAEAISFNLLEDSLTLSPHQLIEYAKIIEKNNLNHLNLPDLSAYQQELHKNNKLYLIIIQLLSLPIEEQIAKIERLQITPKFLFQVLLETITKISYQENHFERFKQLLNGIEFELDSPNYSAVLEALLTLKFDSISIDSFEFSQLFAELIDDDSRDYFALVAIEVFRIDVLRMALFPLKISVSSEIQEALLNNPEILSKFRIELAKSIFNKKNYLKYRIIFEQPDFDTKLSKISAEDIIVSGYKHTSERFRKVLERFSWFDFREVSGLLSAFLEDPKLIQNLIVISNFLETIVNFPELILPTVSFPVLEIIIQNPESFSGLLNTHYYYFKINVPPAVMASILRDDNLYNIIKKNPKRFFNRFYFSFSDAIPLFTEYDWKRLFALSSVPFDFECKRTSTSLKKALIPLNFKPLSESLDIVKHNMFDFILFNVTASNLKSSLEQFLLFDPLLSIWAQYDRESYLQYFQSVNNKLINL